MRTTLASTMLMAAAALPGHAAPGPVKEQSSNPIVLVAGKTCKQVADCEEAVQIWCDGYRRADADHDGIPCENICHSKAQVDEIRERIGC
jgi:hypothetical protein